MALTRPSSAGTTRPDRTAPLPEATEETTGNADRTIGGAIWMDGADSMVTTTVDRTESVLSTLSAAEGIALWGLGVLVSDDPTVILTLTRRVSPATAANLLTVVGVGVASSAASYDPATSPSAWGSTVWGPGISAGSSGAAGLQTGNGAPSVGSVLADAESLRIAVAIRDGRMTVSGTLFGAASAIALTPPAVVTGLTAGHGLFLVLAAGHNLIGVGAASMGLSLSHQVVLP